MFKKNIVKFVVAPLILLTTIAFSGCGNNGNTKVSSIDKIKKAGKIVVGTSADYPPYEFHKSINGKDEIVGFDIEIAKQIAKDLGVKLEIKDMKFDGLLAALDSGNVDFVMAGMTPTEDRKKNVDFSKVYYVAVQSIVVRNEDKDKIKTLQDLNGKKIGVQKGAIQEEIAKKQISNTTAVALGKIPDLVLQLKNNKVDAIMVELPVAKAYVDANKDMTISSIKLQTEESGSAIALKKCSTDLVKSMNKTLENLINDKSIDKFVTDATNEVE